LSEAQRQFFQIQRSQIKDTLINQHIIEPEKARVAADRLAAYSVKKESEGLGKS